MNSIVERLRDYQESWAESINRMDCGEFSDNGIMSQIRAEQHATWKEAADEIETLRREREELLAAINKFLSDNNPEGFGCACEPNRLCGPCSEAKRQAPLYAAIAKVKP